MVYRTYFVFSLLRYQILSITFKNPILFVWNSPSLACFPDLTSLSSCLKVMNLPSLQFAIRCSYLLMHHPPLLFFEYQEEREYCTFLYVQYISSTQILFKVLNLLYLYCLLLSHDYLFLPGKNLYVYKESMFSFPVN